MNAFRQQALNETAGGFDDFTSPRLQVCQRRFNGPFGVFLAHRLQGDSNLLHQILNQVVGKGTVGIDGAASGQIKGKALQGAHVGLSARSQKYRRLLAM